jgi:hypothetical protein
MLWVQLIIPTGAPRLLGGCYRPPDSIVEDLEKVKDSCVAATSLGMEVVIAGDFNIDLQRPREASRLNFMEDACDLHQIILNPTRTTETTSTLIDHIYVSEPRFVAHVDNFPCSLSDHDLIVFVRRHKAMFRSHGGRWVSYRPLRNVNVDHFRADLVAQNLSECALIRDVDDAWDEWYRRFTSVLDRHAPVRRKMFRAGSPVWLNGVVIDTMHVRDRFHRIARRSGLADDWDTYRQARNDVKKLTRQARREYYNNIIHQTLTTDSKAAWRNIRDLLPKKQTVKTTEISHNGHLITSEPEIANVFNDHFAKTCTPIGGTENIPDFDESVPTDVHFIMPPVCNAFVRTELRLLPYDKAVGFDGVSGRVLKLAAPAIATSIAELFNVSLSSGHYPSKFKVAKVCALFKKGTRRNPQTTGPYLSFQLFRRSWRLQCPNCISEEQQLDVLSAVRFSEGVFLQYCTNKPYGYVVGKCREQLLHGCNPNRLCKGI